MSQLSVARIVREIEPTEAGVRKSIEMQNACEPFEQDIWFSLAVTQSLEQAQSAAAPSFIGSSPLLLRSCRQLRAIPISARMQPIPPVTTATGAANSCATAPASTSPNCDPPRRTVGGTLVHKEDLVDAGHPPADVVGRLQLNDIAIIVYPRADRRDR